jgi:thiol:disulfide interchange protein
MERTKDQSVSTMPKALFFATAVLLAARLISLGATAFASSQDQLPIRNTLGWTTLPNESLGNSVAARPAKMETVPVELKPTILIPLLTKGKLDKKLLLCEFSADWSDPCKKMESTSLNNPQIRELIAQHFMPLRIRDTQKENGSNPPTVTDLYKKYRIFAFPTLVVVDEEGEQVASLIGNCSSLSTYRFLSHALFSLNARRG